MGYKLNKGFNRVSCFGKQLNSKTIKTLGIDWIVNDVKIYYRKKYYQVKSSEVSFLIYFDNDTI